MDEYRIRITRQAIDHLREIRRYIEYELLAPIAAKNTIVAIKAEMKSLTHMPARIHLTPEQPWYDQGEFSGGKTPPFRRSGNRDSGRLENVVPVMRKPLRVLFDRLFTAGYPA